MWYSVLYKLFFSISYIIKELAVSEIAVYRSKVTYPILWYLLTVVFLIFAHSNYKVYMQYAYPKAYGDKAAFPIIIGDSKQCWDAPGMTWLKSLP